VRSFALLGVLVVGAFAACGGQTNGAAPPPADDAGSTNTNGDAGAAAPDAAPDAPPDLGSDVYPAPHRPIPTVKNMGGALLTDVKIVTVTYAGEAQRDQLRAFDDAIVAGAWWESVTAGYGINKGTSGGYVELPDDVSGKTLDNDTNLKPYLYDLIQKGTLPAPDANTLYALYFPEATTITLQGQTSCQSFGAYHDSAGFGVNGQTIEAAYAVIPNCGGGRTVSASHEFIEAATDAHPQGGGAYYGLNLPWWGSAGGEVADLCERYGSIADTATGTNVARSWVNAAALASKNPCQPTAPGIIYFNTAIDTSEMVLVHSTTGAAYMSEGFVTVPKGTSKQVTLQVFSEAKLPNDLTLAVGATPRGRGGATSTLNPITAGVKATISETTVRNGMHPTLTITVDPSATIGDYPFVVRSTLNATSATQWPAVLRVVAPK